MCGEHCYPGGVVRNQILLTRLFITLPDRWQFIKGQFKDEKVVAKKVKGSTQDATAIQWLLLQAVDDLSTPHNPVSFVQRICTHGGLAPATPPTQVGQLDSIPYTASYLFYTRN